MLVIAWKGLPVGLVCYRCSAAEDTPYNNETIHCKTARLTKDGRLTISRDYRLSSPSGVQIQNGWEKQMMRPRAPTHSNILAATASTQEFHEYFKRGCICEFINFER